MFTDKSKFQIFGTSRGQYVRRRKGEALKEPYLASTIKHGGGNIQVWELWNVLKEEWYNIPITFIENLYKSINKRLQDVIVNKGGHTKY